MFDTRPVAQRRKDDSTTSTHSLMKSLSRKSLTSLGDINEAKQAEQFKSLGLPEDK